MRSAVTRVLGEERSAMFFDRLLHSFFGPADAELLAGIGLNHVRLPINYRHFEDDESPFEIKEEGFRHLDRVIDLCADAGLYTIIDLHAVPGAQNHHWHSDNVTHVPLFCSIPISKTGPCIYGGPGGALQGPPRGGGPTTSSTSRPTRRMSG